MKGTLAAVKLTVSSESEVSVFFRVAAAELSAGAVLALADVKLTVSSESEVAVFFRLNENEVAVAAAELSAGAVLALADVKVVRVEMPLEPAKWLGE